MNLKDNKEKYIRGFRLKKDKGEMILNYINLNFIKNFKSKKKILLILLKLVNE